MTNQEIANRYAEWYRQDKIAEIRNEFFSADIVCREPEHMSGKGLDIVTKGIEAVEAKSKARRDSIAEVHSIHCSEPVVAGDHFSVALGRDLTFKNGQRVQMMEIGVFGLKEGKIVTETFFY